MLMATSTKRWTLEEVHSLPDDGNKYELVRGELFVTPPPNDPHETIIARLARVIDPYVEAHGLGYVYRPRAVVRYDGSEVEPDLLVRQPHPAPTKKDADWITSSTGVGVAAARGLSVGVSRVMVSCSFARLKTTISVLTRIGWTGC